MAFSHSPPGFKCLFGSTSQEILMYAKFRNTSMDIIIRIISILLTAWALHAMVSY